MLRQLATLLIVGLGACTASEHMATAEQGVADFRRHMHARQFSQVYAASTEEFRKSITEGDMTKLFAALHGKLGAAKSAEKNAWNVNYHTSGTFVTLGFQTVFEKGAGTEQFIFRISEGRASLAGYKVNSPLLMAN